jgi:hypothetical protein
MKLPVQAPAVARGGVSRPTRRLGYGSIASAIQPAAGSVVRCSGSTPTACICTNGVATCCPAGETGCNLNETTGACSCSMGNPP